MTRSRIHAGDEGQSFVLTLFIAFSATRYSRVIRFLPKIYFNVCFSLGERSSHSIFCATCVAEAPWSWEGGLSDCSIPGRSSSSSLPMNPCGGESLPFLGMWAGTAQRSAQAFPQGLQQHLSVSLLFPRAGALWPGGVAVLNWKYCDSLRW